MKLGALVGSAVAALCMGCASYPAPQQHVADSTAALRSAIEVGARNQPQAALNLRLAQEELDRAKGLMNDGKNEPADYMAMRAKADAELALELTRQVGAQSRAAQSESTARAVEGGAHVVPPPAPTAGTAVPSPPAVTP